MDFLPKILDAKQTKKADEFTIKNKSIASIDLMENASKKFVETAEKHISKKDTIAIVAGIGNNGGDGFAIARILIKKGFAVTPILVKISDKLSKDCKTNYDKLEDVFVIENENQIPDFSNFTIIIDAIFGSGLSRAIEGFAAKVVQEINYSNAKIISVDIPSGMFCDSISSDENIVKCDLTITFQRPKLSFFLPEYNDFLKSWKVVDIGLNESFIQSQKVNHFVINQQVKKLLKTRKRFSHKGTYGHALIIAGSFGKMGAAILITKAGLRAGAGLVTNYVPKCGYEIMQISVPEAMCLVDNHQDFLTELPEIADFSAIAIGPGIGKNPKTIKVVTQLLQKATQPLVLDADALNILSENKKLLDYLPKNSILTPHIKEFDRLVGKSIHSLERFEKQQQFSKKHQCIVVLKDAHTCVSDINGNLHFNTTGNPGMATGGSGDVLTGIITGLLAQQYTPKEAALLGVYFHGLAGDLATNKKGQNAVLASDIVTYLRIEK